MTMPLAPAPYPSITKRPTYRGGGGDFFSDYLWGDIITEQRQAVPQRIDRAALLLIESSCCFPPVESPTEKPIRERRVLYAPFRHMMRSRQCTWCIFSAVRVGTQEGIWIFSPHCLTLPSDSFSLRFCFLSQKRMA